MADVCLCGTGVCEQWHGTALAGGVLCGVGEWGLPAEGATELHDAHAGALLTCGLHGMSQKFIHTPGIPVETAVRLYRRYLKLEPTHAEEYVAYLKAKVGPAGVGQEWAGRRGMRLGDGPCLALPGRSRGVAAAGCP